MNNSEQLPSSNSSLEDQDLPVERYETVEVLHSKLLAISTMFFEKKVGFISDEIINILEEYVANTYIFTDKKEKVSFVADQILEKTAEKSAVNLEELHRFAVWFLKTFTVIFLRWITFGSAGSTIGKLEWKDTIEIFTKKGNRKIFVHEVSHYVEGIIHDLVEGGVLDEVEAAKTLNEEYENRTQERKLEKLRLMISFSGELVAAAGLLLLLAKGMLTNGGEAAFPHAEMLFVTVAGVIYGYIFISSLNSYAESGEEIRASQLAEIVDQFFED